MTGDAMRQIVFDTETTGFNPEAGDRIVEIGGVELIGGAPTGRTFHTYVNPERDMPEGAYAVHGLSKEFLSDKPVFADPSVGAAFLNFVGDAALIAHNAAFDVKFIEHELMLARLPALSNEIIDTLEIARAKYPGAQNSLDALCKRFEISLERRDKHGALLDSQLLADVYIELTGGRQRGLFQEDAALSASAGPSGGRAPRAPRPQPLAMLSTPQERAAHAAFVGQMGENSIWATLTAATGASVRSVS